MHGHASVNMGTSVCVYPRLNLSPRRPPALHQLAPLIRDIGFTVGSRTGADAPWSIVRQQGGLFWFASEDGLGTAASAAFFVAQQVLCEVRRHLTVAEGTSVGPFHGPSGVAPAGDWPILGKPLRVAEHALGEQERATMAGYFLEDLRVMAAFYTPGMAHAALSPHIARYCETSMVQGFTPVRAEILGSTTMLQTLAESRRRQVQIDCFLGSRLRQHMPSAHRHLLVGESIGISALACPPLQDRHGTPVTGADVFAGCDRVGDLRTGFTANTGGDVVLEFLLERDCTLLGIVLQPLGLPKGFVGVTSISVFAGPSLDAISACAEHLSVPEASFADGRFRSAPIRLRLPRWGQRRFVPALCVP